MTDQRRECLSKWVLIGVAVVMVVGFWSQGLAQSLPTQDAINATLLERQVALSARLDKIEGMLAYGMVGVFGNLVAHLFQITKGKR